MRQDAATVDVDLVANRNIITQDGNVLQARPPANCAVPADDGALDPGVVLDLGVTQEYAALKPDTIADHDVGANGNVGPDTAVCANLCGWVYQDIAAVDKGLRCWGEKLAVPLGER